VQSTAGEAEEGLQVHVALPLAVVYWLLPAQSQLQLLEDVMPMSAHDAAETIDTRAAAATTATQRRVKDIMLRSNVEV